jgi:hypothetical protein
MTQKHVHAIALLLQALSICKHMLVRLQVVTLLILAHCSVRILEADLRESNGELRMAQKQLAESRRFV